MSDERLYGERRVMVEVGEVTPCVPGVSGAYA